MRPLISVGMWVLVSACGETSRDTRGDAGVRTSVCHYWVPSPVLAKCLTIVSLYPKSVFIEGTDNVSVRTENGCGRNQLTIEVDGIAIPNIQSTDQNNYVFTAPAMELAADATRDVEVRLTCRAPPDNSIQYAAGGNVDVTTLRYDGRAEPNPTIKTPFPEGKGVDVATEVTVTFTRRVDPATVTTDTFGVHGVTGTVDATDPAQRTFRFRPSAPLAYSTKYTVFVKAGDAGVKSAHAHKELKPTLAPHALVPSPEGDEWEFETRCETCAQP